MSALELVLAIAGLTAVTVCTRSLFLVLGDRVPLPERARHALRYAPACALAALIAPELLYTPQRALVAWSDPKLAAAVVAVAVMVSTRSMMAAMALGMGVYALLRIWI
jgi:branched-subunit amino acid transport protein